MKILVVGGAGYIGSHMVHMLSQAGHDVVTLDDLSTGYADAVICGYFIQGSCGDRSILDKVLSNSVDVVMHFASFSQVAESVLQPDKYYQNNFCNTLTLLNAMKDHGIRRFIFSSTAATYGEPQYIPIDEYHPQLPINPYGQSKLMIERVLDGYDQAYGIKSICLRYFNAAGAHPDGILGERHHPETHLIPLLLQVASGRRPYISLYGRDYDSQDGTCIRDYVHVQDICHAHYLALRALMSGADSKAYNLGHGQGYSVLEVVHAVEQATGQKLTIQNEPRRIGDPARLVADPSLVKRDLSWQPKYDLKDMIAHAWHWERSFGSS